MIHDRVTLLWCALLGFATSLAANATTPDLGTWEIPLSSDLTWSAASNEKLRCLGRHLKANSRSSVIIEGHLDRRSSREYALGLSNRPAFEASAVLRDFGADIWQITVLGYGHERAACDSLQCSRANRRLVIRPSEDDALPACDVANEDAELGLAPWPHPFARQLATCIQALGRPQGGVCDRRQWRELALHHAGSSAPAEFTQALEALTKRAGDPPPVQDASVAGWPEASQQAWIAVNAAFRHREDAIALLTGWTQRAPHSSLWTASHALLARIDTEHRVRWATALFEVCRPAGAKGSGAPCDSLPHGWIDGALSAREWLDVARRIAPDDGLMALGLSAYMRDVDAQRFNRAVFSCGTHCFPDLVHAPASLQRFSRRLREGRQPTAQPPAAEAALSHPTSANVDGKPALATAAEAAAPQDDPVNGCTADPDPVERRRALEVRLCAVDAKGLCALPHADRVLLERRPAWMARLRALAGGANPADFADPFVEGDGFGLSTGRCDLASLVAAQLQWPSPEAANLAEAAVESGVTALVIRGALYLVRTGGDREPALRLWEALADSPSSTAAIAELEVRATLVWKGEFPTASQPAGHCQLTDGNQEPQMPVATTLLAVSIAGFAPRETTIGEFRAFLEATSYTPELLRGDTPKPCGYLGEGLRWDAPGYAVTDDYPVTCVTPADARAYAEWRQREEARGVRLPTLAEMQTALQPDGKTPFWGTDPAEACRHGNFVDAVREDWPERIACADAWTTAAPVAQFAPDAEGRYDIAGNVAEITATCAVPTVPGEAPVPTDRCPVWEVSGGSYERFPAEADPDSAIAREVGILDEGDASPSTGFRVYREE